MVEGSPQTARGLDDTLVGFGTHCDLTYKALYESTDRERTSYVQFVRQTAPTAKASRLGDLSKYVQARDAEKAALVASGKAARAAQPPLDAAVWPEDGPPDADLLASIAEVDSCRDAPPAVPPPPLSLSLSQPPERPLSGHHLWGELLPRGWRLTLPEEQHDWVGRALFRRAANGQVVLASQLRLWWHPPGARPLYTQPPATSHPFFQRPFFLWAPYRMWAYHLGCPTVACGGKLAGAGLYKTHTREWMARSMLYLSVLRKLRAPGAAAVPLAASLPTMHPVPTVLWLINVYVRDTLTRLDETRARVTSVFGDLLKMDSTKKITKKLAGGAARTAAWVTNVGNEYGELIGVEYLFSQTGAVLQQELSDPDAEEEEAGGEGSDEGFEEEEEEPEEIRLLEHHSALLQSSDLHPPGTDKMEAEEEEEDVLGPDGRGRHSKRSKAMMRDTIAIAVPEPSAPQTAAEPLPAPRTLLQQPEQPDQPHQHRLPADASGLAATIRGPLALELFDLIASSSATASSSSATPQASSAEAGVTPSTATAAAAAPPQSRTTVWRHKLQEGKERRARELGDLYLKPAKKVSHFNCRRCGQPKTRAFGHSRYKAETFCSPGPKAKEELWSSGWQR
ncbi:unnamed protein product [Merluccius merluccius]